METSPKSFRSNAPRTLDDDTLLRRVFEYRHARQILNGESQKLTRMELETALAELEAEALKRGLYLIDW